jgi:hypothetical protein
MADRTYSSYVLIPLREYSGLRKFGNVTMHTSYELARSEMRDSILREGADSDRRGWLIVDTYGNTTKFDEHAEVIVPLIRHIGT